MLELPEDLRRRLERHVVPYALALIDRSAACALRLHADEAGAEHLLLTLMEDEDCAAHRAVVHAFADPGTIAEEALSLAAGILVTGSAASLPFSEGGVRALESARTLGARRGEASVRTAHVLAAALAALPDDLRRDAEDAGADQARLESAFGHADTPGAVPPGGALFRAFSEPAKRALSAAARLARQERLDAIGPAHLVVACLATEPELERIGGLSAARARMLFRGRWVDPTPPTLRALAADEDYQRFLGGLSPGSGSAELLGRFHAGETPEVAQLLARHRVTPALLERAAGAFRDPPA